MLLPPALGFSPHPPVSVYGTGICHTIAAFLDSWNPALRYFCSLRITALHYRAGFLTLLLLRLHQSSHSWLAVSFCVPTVLMTDGTGISTCCPSTTLFSLRMHSVASLAWLLVSTICFFGYHVSFGTTSDVLIFFFIKNLSIISICGFQGTCAMFPFFMVTSSGDEGIRTHDPLLARQVLSQLSYTPMVQVVLSLRAIPCSIFSI